MEVNNNSFDFLSLPEEIQMYIFSFLTPEQLTITDLVCKALAELSRDITLWKKIPLVKDLVQAHPHIKEMFPDIPENENSFLQAREDHLYLNKNSEKVKSEMDLAAQKGNLEVLKALCSLGFKPTSYTLDSAVRARKDNIVRYIYGNYKEKIQNDLNELKKTPYHSSWKKNSNALKNAKKIFKNKMPPGTSLPYIKEKNSDDILGDDLGVEDALEWFRNQDWIP